MQGRTLCISIPFTWNLPRVREEVMQRSFLWDRVLAGGPAVELIPDYLAGLPGVEIGHHCDGVLQRINPWATRTTVGCPRRCEFCAIGRRIVERGGFAELPEWPDLPVICDNNLLAASLPHFDRVIDRLVVWGWADFNQGLDARLLSGYHAFRLAEIAKPIIRLSLDSLNLTDVWQRAYDRLRAAGIAKYKMRSYCLIGFDAGPEEAWERCRWIEEHGVKALPMWFHELNQLARNIVTDEQRALGWTDYERRRIMQWFYQHRRI